ncbi:MAG: ribonuclease D [Coriobacteriia bacterium]|nr:ribonuclease D [Coriobacteriia bacterium]
MYLHDADSLRTFCDSARAYGRVALDTEFMREKTYWAKLCLIQLAVGDECAILDPLEVDDLSPLCELLVDADVVKVLHAGSQDLEIFYRMCGAAAQNIFDTQVAATLAGFPSQVGYARLVQDLFEVAIDKSDTFTDWARRPLTPAQIEYALNDVRYLDGAYLELVSRLERDGRMQWLANDFERMSDPALYEVVPEAQFKRLKRASSLSRRQLGVLLKVAAWREREAMRRDLPRRWIIGDETLVEVARRRPETLGALADIRGLNAKALSEGGKGLIAAVKEGIAIPEDDLPRFDRKPRSIVDIDGVVELMGALVRVRASEHGIAVPLLATRTDLERLASGEREECVLLEGWRKAIVGDDLVDLVEGRLRLRVGDGKIVVERPVV